MNKRVIILLISIAILIVLGALKLFSNKKEVKDQLYIHDTSEAIFVEASSPEIHTFESSLSFLGIFEPSKQNTIGSDASGKIIKLFVEEGDFVSKGQVIAKIDDELLQLQLQNAEINLESQRNDDNRYSNLAKDNAIAGVQVEKSKLGLRSAEVQIKQIHKQLKSTTITAPFSGVITKKMIDLGSVIGPGSPIVELTDISNVKLTVSVPERDVLKFKTGQNVDVYADVYDNNKFSGKISYVSIVADKSHNFEIQITVKNPATTKIMSGMYGSVSLNNSKSTTALSISRKALVGSSKDPKVYVIKNGKAVLVSFTAGTSDGEYIEVVSGLSKDDQIVEKGQINLLNNSPVTTKVK